VIAFPRRDLMKREDPPMSDANAQGPKPARRPYRKPELVAFGRVEDMTRGGSSSGGEPSKTPKRA